MALFHRVRAVVGRLVPHPASLLSGDSRMIGHVKDYDGVTYPRGQGPDLPNNGAVPRRVFRYTDEVAIVQETRDAYLRNRIQDGDLEYVESTNASDIGEALKPETRWFVDAALAQANAKNFAQTENLAPTAASAQSAGE
jgi:hypothetical protein